MSEINAQVTRLNTLEEERVRAENTGAHMSARRMGIEGARPEETVLKAALKNNASLIAVLASLAAIGSSLVQWFLSK